eukprot:3890751-Prymnesium_polylepis.1
MAGSTLCSDRTSSTEGWASPCPSRAALGAPCRPPRRAEPTAGALCTESRATGRQRQSSCQRIRAA